MILDQLWQLPDLPAHVHSRRRIRHLCALEYRAYPLVGLEFLRNVHDRECACVEGLCVFRGAEPLVPKADHLFPVDVDKKHNKGRYHIRHHYVRDEVHSPDVADGHHGEDGVVGFGRIVFDGFADVDGDENGACEDGDAGEQVAKHAEEAEEGDCVEADFVD